MESLRKFLFVSAVVIGLSQTLPAHADNKASAEELLPADLLQIASTEAFSKHVFLVDKKERKLMVFERAGEQIKKVGEFVTDIGKNDGDKRRENDNRTPEGIYFFQERLSQPEIPFSLYGKMAFTTNYPNFFDRLERKTGYGIWLHSIPDSVPLTRGSRGCVVVRNENLDQIRDWIQLKQTPIIIFDKIEYVTKAEHDKKKEELLNWLQAWRKAWESKEIASYLSYYSPSFRAPGFSNLKAWERHKNRLFNLYDSISLQLDQPYILLHKDQLIVKVLQQFSSDKHSDYGIKTMYARKVDGQFKIVYEEWTRSDAQGTSKVSGAQSVTTGHPTN